MLLVLRRPVPVEVESTQHDPSLMKRVVLEPLLIHEAIECYGAMLLLCGIICGDLIAVVMLLRGPFVLNLTS